MILNMSSPIHILSSSKVVSDFLVNSGGPYEVRSDTNPSSSNMKTIEIISKPSLGILKTVSRKIFSDKFLTSDFFIENRNLFAPYLDDPNKQFQSEINKDDPDHNYCRSLFRNPKLDFESEQLKNYLMPLIIEPKFSGNEFKVWLSRNDPPKWFIKELLEEILNAKEEEKYIKAKSLNSFKDKQTPFLNYIKHISFNVNAKWVQDLVERDVNSQFAACISMDNKLDINSKFVSKVISKDPSSQFAQNIGSVISQNYYRIKFNSNAKWVHDLIKRHPKSTFSKYIILHPDLVLNEQEKAHFLNANPDESSSYFLGSRPRLNRDTWVEDFIKNNPQSKFTQAVNKNPYLKLKESIGNDLPALEKAIRANPEKAKKTPLGRLLIEEGIVSLTN
jgi:hypothetical protein